MAHNNIALPENKRRSKADWTPLLATEFRENLDISITTGFFRFTMDRKIDMNAGPHRENVSAPLIELLTAEFEPTIEGEVKAVYPFSKSLKKRIDEIVDKNAGLLAELYLSGEKQRVMEIARHVGRVTTFQFLSDIEQEFRTIVDSLKK